MVVPCGVPVVGNRRTFWTWQPCRTRKDECGNECAVYGLEMTCPTPGCIDDPEHERLDTHRPGDQRTFKTNDWLRSLIVSILGTDGRKPENPCGYRPGSRAGHWSDSYRNGRYPGTVGTSIRDLTAHGRIADAMQELRAYIQYDMQKLVTYGVAARVEVEAVYKGSNTVALNIIVYGQGLDNESRVGFNVTRIANAWVWDT